MDKVLVNVYIPIINIEYDVRIPRSITIVQAKKLMLKAIEVLTNGNYISSYNEKICWKEKNLVLYEYCLVGDYCIQDGDTIILI